MTKNKPRTPEEFEDEYLAEEDKSGIGRIPFEAFRDRGETGQIREHHGDDHAL